jgi:FixJ family two-component response regulator
VARERLVAVVDDDDSFRVALVELLRSMAYGVRGFASAEAFVAAGEMDSYGCIITDIHMPGMSGIDLKQFLNAQALGVPVVMITGRAEPNLESRVAASGAVRLLRKPFDADTLIDCLETILTA